MSESVPFALVPQEPLIACGNEEKETESLLGK